MTRAQKLDRLQEIFRDVLDQPALHITESFSPADCPEWDSVATVQIVLAAEAEFAMRVPTATVAHLHCVRELLDLVP